MSDSENRKIAMALARDAFPLAKDDDAVVTVPFFKLVDLVESAVDCGEKMSLLCIEDELEQEANKPPIPAVPESYAELHRSLGVRLEELGCFVDLLLSDTDAGAPQFAALSLLRRLIREADSLHEAEFDAILGTLPTHGGADGNG